MPLIAVMLGVVAGESRRAVQVMPRAATEGACPVHVDLDLWPDQMRQRALEMGAVVPDGQNRVLSNSNSGLVVSAYEETRIYGRRSREDRR